MAQPWQSSLFDDAEDTTIAASVDPSAFDRATVHALDEHSWITHIPALVRGHTHLLNQLAALDIWEQRSRWMYNRMVKEPRLTAEYVDVQLVPRMIGRIIAVLSAQYDVLYNRVWMNWYRSHRDGTGWHADRPANKAPTATVPVLSLGAPRRFLIRPGSGGPSTAFTPAGGDVIVMHGRCQRDWQHCVPKQNTPAGPRMSLNFSTTLNA